MSLHLFLNKKLMTNFKEKIGIFADSNKEEDNILYLEYADEAPFGFWIYYIMIDIDFIYIYWTIVAEAYKLKFDMLMWCCIN